MRAFEPYMQGMVGGREGASPGKVFDQLRNWKDHKKVIEHFDF